MRKCFALLLILASAPAFADPGIDVVYRDGQLRVTLQGNYAGSSYQAWRSDGPAGEYQPLTFGYTLCTGECFAQDDDAIPGRTYYYRFELVPAGGEVQNFGPYAVPVPDTPLGARIWPNPSGGSVRVELSAPGSSRRDPALSADARVVDLQGRTVRLFHAGALARGLTSFTWDGTDDSGRPLGAGVYFLRLRTPIGSSSTRLVRFR